MASNSSIIDLTSESPPNQAVELRRSSSGSVRGRQPGSSDAAGPSRTSEAIQRRPSQQGAQPSARRSLQQGTRRHATSEHRSRNTGGNNTRGGDDDDDDIFFIGMTEAPAREPRPEANAWQRAFLGLAEEPDDRGPGGGAREAPPGLRFHEGLHQGPYRRGTNVRPVPGIHHRGMDPILVRASFPALLGNPFEVTTGVQDTLRRFPSVVSSYLDAVLGATGARRPAPGAAAAARRAAAAAAAVEIPEAYDPAWTHPMAAGAGFSDDFIEPPVDLDTYFDDKAVVTGPLPDTTPICARCRHALVLGGAGDKRIWVLPCGHVLDGRCVAQLSGVPSGAEQEMAKVAAVSVATAASRRKGKGKAVDEPAGEPPAKALRSTRSRAVLRPSDGAAAGGTVKRKRFKCPVEGCGQLCHMERGHKTSCIETFM
ncbi:hypothetical protein ACQY0O_000658 [Thecaphora frezii]